MSSVTPATWSYTEYARLPGSVADDAAGVKEAAKQFESLFINMWLKSARDANTALVKDGLFGGSEMQMQQQMFDSQMAMHMAKEGGVGLAGVIERQLGGQTNAGHPRSAADLAPPARVERSFAASARHQAAPTTPPAELEVIGNGHRAPAFDSPASFITSLAEPITRIASRAGLPGTAILAQAALETGWGSQVIHDASGRSSHNLFGIKASQDDGDDAAAGGVQIESREYVFGSWREERSTFRSYESFEDAVQDYVEMISANDRYREAAEVEDPATYARELHAAGYATDPNYAEKIAAIVERITSGSF